MLGLYHIYSLPRFTSDSGCLPFQPFYKSSEMFSINLVTFLSYLDFLVFACEHPDSYQCGHRKPTTQLWGRGRQTLAIDGYVRETETSLHVSSKKKKKKAFDIGHERTARSPERTEEPRPEDSLLRFKKLKMCGLWKPLCYPGGNRKWARPSSFF